MLFLPHFEPSSTADRDLVRSLHSLERFLTCNHGRTALDVWMVFSLYSRLFSHSIMQIQYTSHYSLDVPQR